jgi:hypothetical protein
VVGVAGDSVQDGRVELVHQQRLIGLFGGRIGTGEVDAAAVGQAGQGGGVGWVALGDGVVTGRTVGLLEVDLAPVAQAGHGQQAICSSTASRSVALASMALTSAR